jgi:hypothetical protein
MRKKLPLVLVLAALLGVGCNAVFGIEDLDVEPGDAGDAGGDSATGDAATDSQAATGGDAGPFCATYRAGVILCEDYDEMDAGPPNPSDHVVIDPATGSVQIFGAAPAPPSPPNVLATTTAATGATSGQASEQYDPDAASPLSVTVDVQVYLAQAVTSGGINKYVVPLTVNFLGATNVEPYNIELALAANSTDLLTQPALPDGGQPINDQNFAEAGLAPQVWHHVVLELILGQNASYPVVTATLKIDGSQGITAANIGDFGGYGAPEIFVGNTYVAPNVGAQTVYIDDLLVTAY